jgi:hypothetical protein
MIGNGHNLSLFRLLHCQFVTVSPTLTGGTMKPLRTLLSLLISAVVLFLAGGLLMPRLGAAAQEDNPEALTLALGTAFTYQGRLVKSGTPLTDTCDLRFRLFDAAAAGTQIGATLTLNGQSVTAGLFTVQLDFGQGAFNGDARWLEIAPKCTGDASFVVLNPRQPLTPAPYALALPGLYTQENGTSPNLIGGYNGNLVTTGAFGATVSGGGSFASGTNDVTDNYGTVGGGANNQAGDAAGATTDATFATVGGGLGNTAGEIGTTVGGGNSNTATGEHATVGGGSSNEAIANRSTVAGGQSNLASGEATTVAGGNSNQATALYAAVTGGADNLAEGEYSFIGGGNTNEATAEYATISGGLSSEATGEYATIGGGDNNTASANWATVSGGGSNQATGIYNTIAGGQSNVSSTDYTVIGGGFSNEISDSYSTIGGGNFNDATGFVSTIGGGAINLVSGDYSTVPGGTRAVASHYGEMAYASGRFATNGDAQSSLYVLRGTTTSAGLSELFLDGTAARMTIPINTIWTFDIIVAGRTAAGNAGGGYRVVGVIENAGGVVTFIGTPTVSVLGEDVAAWNLVVTADNTNDALTISASGTTGTTIRWVAVVRTAQVTY